MSATKKKKFVPNFIMVIDVFSFSQMAEAHLKSSHLPNSLLIHKSNKS